MLTTMKQVLVKGPLSGVYKFVHNKMDPFKHVMVDLYMGCCNCYCF